MCEYCVTYFFTPDRWGYKQLKAATINHSHAPISTFVIILDPSPNIPMDIQLRDGDQIRFSQNESVTTTIQEISKRKCC